MTLIRVGVEADRPSVLERARAIGAPVLVSANSLWRDGRFRGWERYADLDVALDSGGFVAMRRYGGYRFTVDQYGELVGKLKPAWWAQMDFCCEPELAADRKAVSKRIEWTATHLQQCRAVATSMNLPMPLLVLQGWKPDDYCRGPIYDQDAEWPSLIGVGSVCRRQIHGPDGLLSVVRALDNVLPPHVRFHLFGVKGAALRHLAGHPRFGSMDSMAWSMRARWFAVENQVPCDAKLRASHLEQWYLKQKSLL